ncbi:hypothetical protein ACIF6H_35710 [Streptomyces microflavus]|uniref:hypothetical protein n=1 Tax=Streptomyces microflavus TaxID=1919 RepID=UPI00348932CA
MTEVGITAGECGAAEIDLTAREKRASEVAAVEGGSGEVEVKPAPGGVCGGVLEVVADGGDDGEADFALAVPECGCGGVGLVGHAEVGAEHVDANLPLFGPVVGEACHGVDPGEPDRRLLVAELFGGLGVPLGELGGIGPVGGALVQELLAVGVQGGEDGTYQGQDGDGRLDDVLHTDRLLTGGLTAQEELSSVVEAEGGCSDEEEGAGGDEPDGPEVRCVAAVLLRAGL